MSEFYFQLLIELCRTTHEKIQNQAARSVDLALVARNWLYGWYIVEFEQGGAERDAISGKTLIAKIYEELKAHGIKGCSPTNLRKCRAFYLAYREELKIGQLLAASSLAAEDDDTMSITTFHDKVMQPRFAHALSLSLSARFQLGWSHYVSLLSIQNPEERRFYEIETVANSWSVRELERQIDSALYERLALSRDKDELRRLSEQGLVLEKTADVIKNPFILEFLGLEERTSYSEGELESAIIDKLEHFLLELGKGFLFEARQKRFTFDNDHFYVDLVFFNRLLRCYVLIDLKIDKLTHQDLGQMQMYVNYFDRHVKLPEEHPTIGIILCKRKNDALVELTLPQDASIYASEYKLYLPSKEELRQKLLDWSQDDK